MPFQTKLTKQISKRVRHSPSFFESIRFNSRSNTELDALGMEEEEEEGPSYLADLNKAPDFIDEAPFEVTEVRIRSS